MDFTYKDIVLRNFIKDYSKISYLKNSVYQEKINNGECLFFAVKKGDINIVKVFLERYPQLVNKDFEDEYPLVVASEYGFVDIVDYLLANGGNPNRGYPLITAVANNNIDIVRKLCDAGANPNSIEYIAFYDDYYEGNYDIYQQDGIHSPLKSALEYNNIDIINILLNYGLNIYSDDTLIWACHSSDNNMLLYLLETFRIPADNFVAMVMCIINNKYDMLETLIKFGANINNTDEDGDSVCIKAAKIMIGGDYINDIDIEELQHLGADLDAVDENNDTIYNIIDDYYADNDHRYT